MSPNRNKFTDETIAAMMATQTAIFASVCERLIKNNMLERSEIVNDLHELLSEGLIESPQGMGPLKHLLALLDK